TYISNPLIISELHNNRERAEPSKAE
ncbi:unnamed protein product, partial [Allacma fusca]